MLALVGAAESQPSPDLLDVLQISAEQRGMLVRGDIVTYPVLERTDRELAVGLAIYMLCPLGQLADYLVAGQLIARDATIADLGLVPGGGEPTVAARFTASDRGEAESLLQAAPGFRFNLSTAEIDALRAARDAANPGRTEAAAAAIETYRRLLQRRVQAYQQSGLAGVAPYARSSSGTVTDPTAELRLAIADAERIGGLGAELRDLLLNYPRTVRADAGNQIYWTKRYVQRRPNLGLLHASVLTSPGLVLHVERYFYVGHSYNAAQILTGAVPYSDGTVVFATSRFSTDEILGVGNQLKRSVGRGQLRDEMRKRLERLRVSQLRPPSLQSP